MFNIFRFKCELIYYVAAKSLSEAMNVLTNDYYLEDIEEELNCKKLNKEETNELFSSLRNEDIRTLHTCFRSNVNYSIQI